MQSTYGQKFISKERHDSIITALAIGNQAQLDLITYKAENDELLKQLAAKNVLISQYQDKVFLQENIIDSLKAIQRTYGNTVAIQQNSIDLLNKKPSKIHLSLFGGYGALFKQTVTAGPVVGLGLTYTIF